MFHRSRNTLLALAIGLLIVAPSEAQQAREPASQQQIQTAPAPAPQSAQQGSPQPTAGKASGQRPAPAAPQSQPAIQIPAPFQLNSLEQAALDQVLSAWETSSNRINTFRCDFERYEYNAAFGPD